MTPNIRNLITGRPLVGFARRIQKQLEFMETSLAQQSQQIESQLQYSMPVPNDVPQMDQVPIDANKIAEGQPVAESIEYNGLV